MIEELQLQRVLKQKTKEAAFAYGLEKLPLELLRIYDKMLQGEFEK